MPLIPAAAAGVEIPPAVIHPRPSREISALKTIPRLDPGCVEIPVSVVVSLSGEQPEILQACTQYESDLKVEDI